MNNRLLFAAVAALIFIGACDDSEKDPIPKNFTITNLRVDDRVNQVVYTDVPVNPVISITFSEPIDRESAASAISLIRNTVSAPTSFSFSNQDSTVIVMAGEGLEYWSAYNLRISPELESIAGNLFGSTHLVTLRTGIDTTDKFPRIPNDSLLTAVQKQTFKFFWDFGHPTSGMARERNTSGDLVTTGGTGFGLMAIIVGIERNFITRTEGLNRLDKILAFLETADRFHGVWPHWINGVTGKVIPFSTNDNGADLVETSFLAQGLLTFRQYMDGSNTQEKGLIDRINALLTAIEWNWFTKNENVLYWHWSPDKAWIMNHKIVGYNEALITYVMAASSLTDTIDPAVYYQGWANNGGIKNGRKFYEITLPLGYDYGGPLFFAHYSFLGLDPRTLEDTYANYWTQNVNHTLINHAYVVDNPKNFAGYSEDSWGLTASDNRNGYAAHSPSNDLGYISPTAALSSFPYTPEQSTKALHFFYYKLGDKLWGEYGFRDAYSISELWVADSYLAIDQGPIIIMIENHRTGLLWNLFMSAPEVQSGLTKLGFTF